MAASESSPAGTATNPNKRVKLTGRAFYESIGSPRVIVAPMVDRSEFAWRLLTRSYLDAEETKHYLAYTPMLHARLFTEQAKFRDSHFQPTHQSLETKEPSTAPPWLDGNPTNDRPLFVQFCANKPDELLEAAQYVAPYCDAVDLNLGCPQGIAKNGHYGAFLQEDWDTIHALIRRLRDELSVPVTAKMRVLDTKEKTLEYAKMILNAGASILTVHGRRREQKGHNMGVADWKMIRYLRDNLPPETVLFANGNILNAGDVQPCLDATGADGVMSAEGNLSDPTIFAKKPTEDSEVVKNGEYWQHPTNPEIGGYRLDGVFRRYMDIIHRYVLEREPPKRLPLFVPSKPANVSAIETAKDEDMPPAKRQKTSNDAEISVAETKRPKKDLKAIASPNLKVMQGHLFQLLRPIIGSHTNIRDALAKTRAGHIQMFEDVLTLVEEAVKEGLMKEQAEFQLLEDNSTTNGSHVQDENKQLSTKEKYGRPYWICQPYIRPLPEEAIKIGAMTLSKKEKAKQEAQRHQERMEREKAITARDASQQPIDEKSQASVEQKLDQTAKVEQELSPKEALVCG